jgi:hypothetical protein
VTLDKGSKFTSNPKSLLLSIILPVKITIITSNINGWLGIKFYEVLSYFLSCTTWKIIGLINRQFDSVFSKPMALFKMEKWLKLQDNVMKTALVYQKQPKPIGGITGSILGQCDT